jgi:hypothetical protein
MITKAIVITQFKKAQKDYALASQATSVYNNLDDFLKEDIDILNSYLEINYKFFDDLPSEIKDDPHIIKSIIKTSPFFLYKALSNRMKQNHDVIYALLETKQIDALDWIFADNPELSKNKDFLMKAMTISGDSLKCIPENFKEDEDIVKTAIKNTIRAIIWLPPRFKENPEKFIMMDFEGFLRLASKISSSTIIKNIRDSIFKNNDDKFHQFMETKLTQQWINIIQSFQIPNCFDKNDSNYPIELNYYLPYTLPHWKSENITLILNQCKDIKDHKVKNGMIGLFHEELKRREIQKISLEKSVNISEKKQSKFRKVF